MAANKLLRRGMTGDLVSQTQTALADAGYDVDVDGVFGPQTETAVMDYQKNNGLDVDGVVGPQTQAALGGNKGTGTGSTTGTNKNSTASGFTYNEFKYDDFSYADYEESDTVTAAKAALDAQLAAKPGDFQFSWADQTNSIIDQILNREAFSYDVNSDALYQQYKDQYTSLGKLAMMDTMGQAAAMTGGYGNSYASTAGNQAYQSYLSQLNEVVPELYGMALDKYNQEGEELYNQYSLLADREDQEYGMYQDEYNNWFNMLQYLDNNLNNERNFDYGKYSDDRNFKYGVYSDDRNLAYNINSDKNAYGYNAYRDAIADEQWEKEFGLNQQQMAIQQEQWELEKTAYADSAKSYSGTTSGGKSYNNGSLTNAQVKELQAALGVDADGYYGYNSQKAAGKLSADEAYAKYVGGDTGDDAGGDAPVSDDETGGDLDGVITKLKNYTTKQGQDDFLAKLVNNGEITKTQSFELMEEYGVSELTDRSWEKVNNGGTNWFGGVDNNAVVRDENGKEYTLKALRKELEKTMTPKEAKNYLKKLQETLGI